MVKNRLFFVVYCSIFLASCCLEQRERIIFSIGLQQNPKSMRYFVNKKLSEKDNKLYSAFIKVMNDNADLFAESLLNLILKSKLYDKLDVNELKKYQFNFALVTGIGDTNKKNNTVTISRADVLPLETTLCGLTRLEKMFKNKKYEIKIDKQKSERSKGAKVFLRNAMENIKSKDAKLNGRLNKDTVLLKIIK